MSKHIIKIQSRWRGYKARAKIYAEIPEDAQTPETSLRRKRLMPPPRTPIRGNSENISGKLEATQILPTEVPKVHEKLPFDKNYEIVVLIDGITGLPLTSTATRISCVLYMPTKQQIGESFVSSVSDMQSEFTNPHFAIRVRWKGETYIANKTIL